MKSPQKKSSIMSVSPPPRQRRIDKKSKSPLQQIELSTLDASSYRTTNSISPVPSRLDDKIRRRGVVQCESTDSSFSRINECKENRPGAFKSPLKFGGSPIISSKTRKTNHRLSRSSDSAHVLGPVADKIGVSDILENNSKLETTIIFSSPSDQSVSYDSEDDKNDGSSINLNSKDQDDFVQIMSRHRSGNNLHSLCGCMSTVGDLMQAKSYLFGNSPDQASRRDFKGETVLHAFSNNKTLATIIGNPNNEDYETKDFLTLFSQPSIDKDYSDQLNKLVEKFLVDDLLRSSFCAPIVEDNDGRIPFEAALIDWIASCQNEIHGPRDDVGYFSAYSHKVSDAVTHAWESTSTTLMSAIAFGGKAESKVSESQLQGIPHNDIEKGDTDNMGSISSSSQPLGKSKITPHARFCLRMLSLILDELDKFTDGFRNMGMDQRTGNLDRAVRGVQQIQDISSPSDLCTRIVGKVASIPHLLEVIFSINDDTDLEFSLSTKIIRRVLVNKHSVGPWLTTMLQSPQRQISQRAIDYLQIVSSLCSGKQRGHKEEKEANLEDSHYDDLIDEVSRLNDFIPSLLALGDKVIEEVSTTLIVKKVLDKMIARPFVATVVLCDAIFLILMIVGFRAAVNGMILGDDLDTVLKWIYVANMGIFYFIISEIGKFVSLFLLSKHSRNYILSFWNLIDVLAVLLAAVSSVTMRWRFHENGIEDDKTLRVLLAITTGFLWLRVLNFLKAINMQLATFVLAILQITKDIFWFCVIILTLVVSFAQMFFTVLAPPACATGNFSDIDKQCKQNEYLLKVYTILLGDFGDFKREDFVTNFSVFLVVFYSFFVTLVLVNVLIAIASDSYEKCLLKSQKLFGRARVMLIAELSSFQTLLRKKDQDDTSSQSSTTEGVVYSKWWTSSGLTRNWSRGSVLFFMLSMFVMICWTFSELVGYIQGERVGSILLSLSSVLINMALYIIIMVFLDRNSATKNDTVDRNNEWSNSLQTMVLWVLGVSQRTTKDSSRSMKRQDVWHGRVEFLQREMDRIADRQTELVMTQSENLQSLMNLSEKRVRTEINLIENRFKVLEASVQEEQNETKKMNLNITQQLQKLISSVDGTTI